MIVEGVVDDRLLEDVVEGGRVLQATGGEAPRADDVWPQGGEIFGRELRVIQKVSGFCQFEEEGLPGGFLSMLGSRSSAMWGSESGLCLPGREFGIIFLG